MLNMFNVYLFKHHFIEKTCILYNLDEEKIKCTVDIKCCFFARQESRECFIFISNVRTHSIYLSLTFGSAKFKQQDFSCSFF